MKPQDLSDFIDTGDQRPARAAAFALGPSVLVNDELPVRLGLALKAVRIALYRASEDEKADIVRELIDALRNIAGNHGVKNDDDD